MAEPPRDVVALAEQRAQARADRDFAAADRLRDEPRGNQLRQEATPIPSSLYLSNGKIKTPWRRKVYFQPESAKEPFNWQI